jgi:predicted phosphodiesterase
VARIRAVRPLVVQGNHDLAVASRRSPGGPDPFRSIAEATLSIANTQLDGESMDYLRALPTSAVVDVDGLRCLLVHATPHDPLHRAVGPDPDAWRAELAGVEAGAVLVGHTHIPFDLQLGHHRVVNPGSVGLPLDGDPRAAYAVIEDGTITLRRSAYSVERTVAALRRARLDGAVLDALIHWLRTGSAPSHLPV